MKGTFVFLYLFAVSWTFAQEDVNHLIADAEQMEKKGETDSAITVLKTADKMSPDNVEVTELLAQQYVLKVDDATDSAASSTLSTYCCARSSVTSTLSGDILSAVFKTVIAESVSPFFSICSASAIR